MMKSFIFSILEALLLIYIFLSTPLFIVGIPFLFIKAFCVFLVFWAFMVKRLSKHFPLNQITRGVYLVTEGPYEIIRHPIYAGVLLFVSSTVQEYFTFLRFVAFLLFLILILRRINQDEKKTELHFKQEYSEYKKKTKRLVPYLY